MSRVVGRLRRLTLADGRAVVESLALALRVEIGLRRMPLSTLVERLGRPATGPVTTTLDPPTVADGRRLARIAEVSYQLLPIRSTCLREGLVLYALVRRRGGAAVLRLGVKKNGSELAAHAWVEYQGVSFGEVDATSGVAEFTTLQPALRQSATALDR